MMCYNKCTLTTLLLFIFIIYLQDAFADTSTGAVDMQIDNKLFAPCMDDITTVELTFRGIKPKIELCVNSECQYSNGSAITIKRKIKNSKQNNFVIELKFPEK